MTTTKTLQELRDDLREAEGYRDDSVGESCFGYYRDRASAIRKQLYAHPDAIALAERFAREREERLRIVRDFYTARPNLRINKYI